LLVRFGTPRFCCIMYHVEAWTEDRQKLPAFNSSWPWWPWLRHWEMPSVSCEIPKAFCQSLMRSKCFGCYKKYSLCRVYDHYDRCMCVVYVFFQPSFGSACGKYAWTCLRVCLKWWAISLHSTPVHVILTCAWTYGHALHPKKYGKWSI